MIDIASLSRKELAALLSQYLRDRDIDVVLTGGSCVSIYSNEKYVSKDLDFIDNSLKSNRQIAITISELGFKQENKNSRHFAHPDTELTVEFPSAPLTVGDEVISSEAVSEIKTDSGTLRLLSPTDCVKDRMANYIYFKDRQCLHQAAIVVALQAVNLSAVEKWCKAEGSIDYYQELLEEIKRQD